MKFGFAILLLTITTLAHAQPLEASPASFAAREEKPAPTETDREDLTDLHNLDSFTSVYQPYVKNISYYQPMYFLVGIDPEESKFQFSFKYRFFDPENSLAKNHPWMKGIHFAYTQTSFWDLASSSKPFEDTSYKPELFYMTDNIPTGINWLKGCFVQGGVQHESNGRGGEDSRSTNFIYLEPSFVFMNKKELIGLKISPRVWLYTGNDDETNPDIADYRGYFDLRLTFGKADHLIFDTHVRWAKAGASAAVAATYPLHRLFENSIELYLQVEYVNTLAESLLNYDDRNEAVRIGFAIVR